MIPEQVKIDTGLLEGVTGTVHPTVRIFKGIPFAAPPLGENRWKAPQPAAKWDGVRKADAFGPSCIAGPGRPRSRRPRRRRRTRTRRRARRTRRGTGAQHRRRTRGAAGSAAPAASQRRLPDRERLDECQLTRALGVP